ncbi:MULTISPECIES: long-chain fatty acid--CoA ligase [unclassified Thioalkalivibrio]|uniref:AMP-dependent synthetase/ligase n=1 Tax=unclassified Thioalkalivibrio TaxID=2621013 RepID=UPI0003718ABC|nr:MULTISPECIES: long-chain fatty acid--CoA ligase [unclassified Thioalkalivibrio]
MSSTTITPEQAPTLPALFRTRVSMSPDAPAYRHFSAADETWKQTTWGEMAAMVDRWQAALAREGFKPGERVALMLGNSREWVAFDQAATELGLITVPLYTDDRPDNVAYIIGQTQARLLLLGESVHNRRLSEHFENMPSLKRIVCLGHTDGEPDDERVMDLDTWLERGDPERVHHPDLDPLALATIVFTSGTTGRPKGVMLSHRNILDNAQASSTAGPLSDADRFLSFLPLSHMLERTGGYYMPMLIGAEVAFARSIQGLGEDLMSVQPTVLISVPRIYERVHGRIQAGLKQKSAIGRGLFKATVTIGWRRFEYQQGRASWSPGFLLWPLLERIVAHKVLDRLGGKLRFAVCGGAPLPPPIARFFIGLGLPVLHGYGMTESSPVVSVNTPDDNLPASIGKPLPGIEVKIGEMDELLTRSSCVMLGYWKNEEATTSTIDEDHWLHSGDQATIDDDGHIFITGRLKDILVLTNGEKVPPADMEMAIALDALFDQVMVVGDGHAFLSALVVPEPEAWATFAEDQGLDPGASGRLPRSAERALLQRIQYQLRDFPGYAKIRHVHVVHEPWSVDNGMLTPTMKLKRPVIAKHYANAIEAMYAGHD